MRGTLAKSLRRLVYADRPTNPSARKYAAERWQTKRSGTTGYRIVADPLRREYQLRKRIAPKLRALLNQRRKIERPADAARRLRLRANTREAVKAWRKRMLGKSKGRAHASR